MLNRVFVCLSQSLVSSGPLEILESEKIIRQQGEAHRVYQVNPADRCALETAVQLKQNCGVVVVALTLAPQGESDVLKSALASGADNCVHLAHPEGSTVDGWAAAQLIAAYLREILNNSDLILCGESRSDTAGAQVGPFIAELLDLPQITRVTDTTYNPKNVSIEAMRLLERGDRQRVLCSLPAVLAVSRFGPPGRYAAVLNKEQAPIAQIETIPIDVDKPENQPRLQIKSISRPRPRTKKIAAPSAQMSAADRMKFLMSGGQTKTKKESSLFEGSPDAAAECIIDYLMENNLL